MGNKNGAIAFTGILAAVVVVCFTIGYFFRPVGSTPPVVPVQAGAPVAAAPAKLPQTPASPPNIAPLHSNGDYTAPGAPHISIVEDDTPSLTAKTESSSPVQAAPPKQPDSESSQEGVDLAAPATTATTQPDTTTDGTASTSASTTTATTPADGDQTDQTGQANPPADGTAANTSPAGNDADYEETTTGKAPAGDDADATPEFRVQTGAFVAANNAKTLADALRDRGYTTSVRSEKNGDKTVFKVQVGAYHTKAAADKVVSDLESSGYPAYSSPIAH